MTQRESYNYRKQLFHLAIPAMAENILQILMGITDSYLVAHLGLIAISSVSVANNIITVYQAIFIALGSAVSSLVAKYCKQRYYTKKLQLQADSLVLTFLISLILGLLSIFGGRFFLTTLGTTKEVSQLGWLYLSVVGGGIFSLGLLTTLGAIHRAQDRPRIPMYVSVLTNVLNAVLSALAITVFDFGLVGIALSTVLSRLVGVIILANMLDLMPILKYVRWSISKTLVTMTLPIAGERLMMRIGDVAIIAIVVSFGVKVVAGNAIGETITQFNYMPGMGMATAVLILVAQAFSEKDFDTIHKILRKSYIYSAMMMLFVGGCVYLLSPYLLSFFTNDLTAKKASILVALLSFLGEPATAGTLIFTALWQGLGKPKFPFYATTIGMWGIRIFLGYVLGVLLSLGLAGVWLATIADNLFRWVILSWRYHVYQKR
ncbi:MATE family efflux transporter [Streptococcus sciuri]|uniref:Probable multidrug resistance protein NorM n=1 Tax=Streptococcus sciuri TaxID=2973939 RepID=A0ABT2FA81_9STRE|nr:MATE family efflux transporter [Streptococcus sciuri]MCS4488936.1 MATE family efflux transporter [Streptococcus sciuri]